MRQIWLQTRMLVALGCCCLFFSSQGVGQELSSEIKEMFEEWLPQLDGDLQVKVRKALQNKVDYVELTPEQFIRFRDDPANPFQGWHGIDPEKISGLIRLQFESQPIRSRVPGRWERQSKDELRKYSSLVARANASTVEITDGNAQVALGMIVTQEGHIVTKLSEIEQADELFCETADGSHYAAKLLGRDEPNDIAVLKIECTFSPAIVLDATWPTPGSILFSTNGESVPMAIGVCSNVARSLVGTNQAFLGVKPVAHADGVEVVQVTERSSADDAGMRIGDIILSLDEHSLFTVEDLVNTIRGNAPGDKVRVKFLRNGREQEVVAVLQGRNVGGPTADRFKMMETFGAIPSERRSEFPLVFQHDTPLLPEECGGPVVDLQGRVIGMNIARGGRVASYAIPADHLKLLVREILHPNLASNDVD